MTTDKSPFHAGELAAQKRAKVGDIASLASGFIRDYMPQQHMDFYTGLPFLVVSSADAQGHVWVTILEGADGFIQAPNPGKLMIANTLDTDDPLHDAIKGGTDIGIVGIELGTRRRNRMSAHARPSGKGGYELNIRQTFGNCPQYINERTWVRADRLQSAEARHSDALTDAQIEQIRLADTLFIGSGYHDREHQASNGFDASHRGGEPGFVQVIAKRHLRLPDYAGNNFFNTIGNLINQPEVGLLFIDFETGGLLHVSGRAEIDWSDHHEGDANARRMIDIHIDCVVERPGALRLRWTRSDDDIIALKVSGKIREADDIVSLHLVPAQGSDGRNNLPQFKAGQHLPIELDVPGQSGAVKRSYSLSGSPNAGEYRLSIKREEHGIASRFVHDAMEPGDRLLARRPSGDFVIPCGECPLVLISAGIGLTPMVSILHAVANETNRRSVRFFHGARNSRHHALKDEVQRIISLRANTFSHIAYSAPDAKDREGIDYDSKGRITADMILDANPGEDAHYMICGPAKFLSDIRNGLEAGGVHPSFIHFEAFGPSG